MGPFCTSNHLYKDKAEKRPVRYADGMNKNARV
jgi:hypothetical protein